MIWIKYMISVEIELCWIGLRQKSRQRVGIESVIHGLNVNPDNNRDKMSGLQCSMYP